jgi:hypothetical protein
VCTRGVLGRERVSQEPAALQSTARSRSSGGLGWIHTSHVRIQAVSSRWGPNKGPPCRLVLTAEVGRPAEESGADVGKYLGPTCLATLYMTSLYDRQVFDSAAC